MPSWGNASIVEKEGEEPQIKTDWGLFVSQKEDGKSSYGLRYNELIAVLISAVQELSKKVKSLEGGASASSGAAAAPASKRKRTA